MLQPAIRLRKKSRKAYGTHTFLDSGYHSCELFEFCLFMQTRY
jgi:hypothetical protein